MNGSSTAAGFADDESDAILEYFLNDSLLERHDGERRELGGRKWWRIRRATRRRWRQWWRHFLKLWNPPPPSHVFVPSSARTTAFAFAFAFCFLSPFYLSRKFRMWKKRRLFSLPSARSPTLPPQSIFQWEWWSDKVGCKWDRQEKIKEGRV